MEAIVPIENLFPSIRVIHYDETSNSDRLALELEMREEIREAAAIRTTN